MWAAATRTFISILVEHPFGTILWGARRWGFLTPLVEIRCHSIVRRKWCLSFGLHLNSLPPPHLAPAVYSFSIALRLDGPGRIGSIFAALQSPVFVPYRESFFQMDECGFFFPNSRAESKLSIWGIYTVKSTRARTLAWLAQATRTAAGNQWKGVVIDLRNDVKMFDWFHCNGFWTFIKCSKWRVMQSFLCRERDFRSIITNEMDSTLVLFIYPLHL